MILNILMILISISYIIDHSGIIYDFSKFLKTKVLKKEWDGKVIGKPFSCSTCMSFWIILFFCLLTNNIILSLFIASISAIFVKFLSKIIGKIIYIILKIK